MSSRSTDLLSPLAAASAAILSARAVSPSPVSNPAESYASGMGTSLGHALLCPEPHETGEVQIGDVGYFRGGAFVRLFNLDVSMWENTVTAWTPPFEIVDPLHPSVFRDRSTARLPPGTYQGTREDASGLLTTASLELPAGADGEMLRENDALEEYIIRDHDWWYRYARDDLKLDIEPKQLVVVKGWFKTGGNAWSVRAESSLTTTIGGSAWPMRARSESSTSYTGPAAHRGGLGKDSAKRNHCVFVSYYKVDMAWGRATRVVAVGGQKSELEYAPNLHLPKTSKKDPLAEVSKFISSC